MSKSRQLSRMHFVAAFYIVLCCTACVPALEDMRVAPGSPVSFSAVGPAGDSGTKTVYSGERFNVGTTQKYERVDWVVDDCIRVVSVKCPEGYADYKVTKVSGNSDEKSSAQISPAATSGHGLTWGDGTHDFYAIYPAPGATGAPAGLIYTGETPTTVTLPIPATQVFSSVETSGTLTKMLPDMNYAYMYAATRVNDPSANVNLAFKPLFTAFEITVGSDGADELDLYSFYMTATQNLSGTFTVTMNAEGGSWTLGSVTGGSNRINVDLGGSGNPTKVKNDKALTFTVFAVPQATLSGIVLHFETSKGPRTLELKYANGNPIEIHAGQKAVIEGLQIPGTVRVYTIEPIANLDFWGVGANSGSFKVRSYSTSIYSSTPRDEKWKIEYSTDYNEIYGTGTWSSTPASWMTVSGASYYDGREETLTTNVAAQSSPSFSKNGEIQEIHETILKATTAVSNYDLSMHTIHGEVRSLPVTANCYVVKAPGTYVFPLVYGNAIDGTKSDALSLTGVGKVINQEAYQPSQIPDDALNALTRFFNADNLPIDSPFIEIDLGISDVTKLDAIALWQDGTKYGETTPIPIITATPTVVEAPSTSPLKDKCHYISFTINQADIRQGNILIALRDISAGNTASTSKIIWSWQIWVTDEDLHPQEVEMQSGSVQMMPVNVGWCDIQGTVERHDYNDRKCYMRITQVGSDGATPLEGGASTIIPIIQHKGMGYTVYEAGTDIPGYGKAKAYLGSSPYYQFGRKDPFIGRDYTSNPNYPVNIKFSAADGYTITSNDYTVNYVSNLTNNNVNVDLDLGLAIKNPYIFYYSTYNNNHYWYGGNKINEAYVKNFDISSGFNNLWNAFSAGRGNDTRIRKTVYDPCPPDYCLPPRDAFTGFTIDGEAITHNHPDRINADTYDSLRDGYHFYRKRMTSTGEKDPSGGSIFFCRTGLRRHASLRDSYTDWGAYWTVERSKVNNNSNSDRAIHLVINHDKDVEPHYHKTPGGYLTDSWSIRPALEEAW